MQTPKQAFEAAKFHFSFDEWVLWWEKELGPDWLQKRGRRQGQFCMARFRDFGPYEIGNVKCVTSSQNASERSVEAVALAARTRIWTQEMRLKKSLQMRGNKNKLGKIEGKETREKKRRARLGKLNPNWKHGTYSVVTQILKEQQA